MNRKNPYIKWNGIAAESFSGGSGTKEDPYIVTTPAELKRLAELIDTKGENRKFFKLGADIYYNDIKKWDRWNEKCAPKHIWKPIASKRNFCGMIDGCGHTIYGLYTNLPEQDGVGFVKNSLYGTLANITIKNSYFRGRSAVGGFVAIADTASDVINCKNYATVVAVNERAGGIVGTTVSEDREGASVYFDGCKNYGSISVETGGYAYAGGILGYCYVGTIRVEMLSCENYGVIESCGSAVGGIMGGTEHLGFGASSIVSCKNHGMVRGNSEVGGISGRGYATEILMCENYGVMVGKHTVGGIVGIGIGPAKNMLVPIGKCINVGTVCCGDKAGEIAGSVCRVAVSECFALKGGEAVGHIFTEEGDPLKATINIDARNLPAFDTDDLWVTYPEAPACEIIDDVTIVNEFAPRDKKLRFYTNKIEFQSISVSKNDGFLFEYEGTLLLLDSGDNNTEMLNTLLQIREKYMRYKGLDDAEIASQSYKLELVHFLSHYHSDHYRAMMLHISKSPYIKIKEVYYPAIFDGYTEAENVVRRIKSCQPDLKEHYIDFGKPETFSFADGNIVVSLLPSPINWQKYTDNYTYWANCNSVWMHFECNGRKFLFTGDTYDRLIDTELPYPTALDAMVGIYSDCGGKNYLDVDFVKPAHHGRRTTSSCLFEASKAKYLLISVRAYHDRGLSTKSGIKYGDVYFMGDCRCVFEISEDGSVEVLEGRPRNFSNSDGVLITDPNYYYDLAK